jgi:hypothetical protein
VRTVAYVAHKLSAPTAEGMAENRRAASLWCAWLCRHFNVATIADWIVMSSVLDETDANRDLGLDCDFALIRRCDVMICVGTVMSGGMHAEAKVAQESGVPLANITYLGAAVPSDEPEFFKRVAGILGQYGIAPRFAG